MTPLNVIIPSWGPLALEMQLETGCRYPVYIPLGGKLLYEHIIDFYDKLHDDVEFYFVLANDAPPLVTDRAGRREVHEVRVLESGSMGETILAGLAAIGKDAGQVVVHTADTLLVIGSAPMADVIYVEPRSDLYRWTSVAIDGNGVVKVLNDRNEEGFPDQQMACVGLFSFSSPDMLSQLLTAEVNCPETAREPFFAAIEAYSTKVPMRLERLDEWFDCGHVDTYYQSRLGYQNLRHFNSLVYGPNEGQVTKKSRSLLAFRHQVRWFKQAPDSVASFLPRIYDSSDGDEPFITMELLSMPTLGDLFVRERLGLGAWNGVARTIARIQGLFAQLTTSTDVAKQLAYSIYYEKSRKRIAEFCEMTPRAAELWVSHGNERWDLLRVLATLEDFVTEQDLLAIDSLAPIHGDLCFSNLLFDSKLNLVKLIDPRGEFGVPGIFGDPRYDQAKLMHSFEGLYDFIVADAFKVIEYKTGQLSLSIAATEYHRKVRRIFEAFLFPDPSLIAPVKAVQSLLFLSMLPLHVDMPMRQLAMLARGLEGYARCWDRSKKV